MQQAFDDEYNVLTEKYCRDVNDLESSFRSIRGIMEEGYTFLEGKFVEFTANLQTRATNTHGFYIVVAVAPDNIVCRGGNSYLEICTRTERVIAEDNARPYFFEGKRVLPGNREDIQEEEEEIHVPPDRLSFFLHRHDGVISAYIRNKHLLMNNEVYRIEKHCQLGSRHVVTIENVHGKEKIVALTQGLCPDLFFKFNNEWYEIRGKTVVHLASNKATSFTLDADVRTYGCILRNNCLCVVGCYTNDAYLYVLRPLPA